MARDAVVTARDELGPGGGEVDREERDFSHTG